MQTIIVNTSMTGIKKNIDPGKPKIKLPSGKNYIKVKEIVQNNHLHTICESGNCPNMATCWGNGTATFMILGDICTRSCRFCSVKTGKPHPPDENEPFRVANSVKLMNLKHCVITSVDRDDLPDYGSEIWAQTILEIKKQSPEITIETLIPDFNFDKTCLMRIINAKPDVVSHNLETVERLTKQVRVHAKYQTSLNVIKFLNDNGIITKSGIMLGLGETDKEVFQCMDDLLHSGCLILTIGQYLQPTKEQLPVKRFISENEFFNYKNAGLIKGFKIIESEALVRSSYRSENHLIKKVNDLI
ncbi:MAG: lipoyl synthase [Bacteroidota bacterium]